MIKEMAVFGGFAHRSEAVQYQRSLGEDTVLVSVLNGPTGFPVTPLCYFAVSKSLIEQFKEVLDTEPQQKLQRAQEEQINDPSGDFLRTGPDAVEAEEELIAEIPQVEEPAPIEAVEEAPVEAVEETVEPEVQEVKPAKKRVKK